MRRCFVTLLALTQLVWAQSYTVGQRVEVDVIYSNYAENAKWLPGTITRDDGRLLTIRTDDGRTIELDRGSKWIRGSTSGPPTNPTGPSLVNQGMFPGGRVEVDVIYANYAENAKWVPGQIVGENGPNHVIRLDDGSTIELAKNSKWVRSGTAAPVQPALPSRPPTTSTTPVAVPPVAQKPEKRPAESGRGAPPDGLYTLQKIDGDGFAGGAKLEFRGGQYRMAWEDGPDPWAPYEIRNGEIVLTRGLSALPDSWRVISARYVGSDNLGRPLIHIDYSTGHSTDRLDALRE